MAFYLSVYPYFQSYLLVVMGESVTSAGYIVQVFTFASTITTIAIGALIKYTGRYKWFVVIGSFIYVIGLAAMIVFRTEAASVYTLVSAQMLIGVGGGMLHGPAQVGIQASASHQEVAAATAVFLTLLELGGAIGNAISGAIWNNNIPIKLSQYLPPETKDQAGEIFADVALAANGWPLGSPTRNAINQAYQETMTKLLYVAVAVAIPVLILSFFMEDYDLSTMNQHVVGTVIGGETRHSQHFESESIAGSSRRRRRPSNHESTGLLHGDSSDDESVHNFSSSTRANGEAFRKRT